jgi:GLPGLI family protein
MKTHTMRFAMVFLVFLFTASSFSQGLYWESTTTGLPAGMKDRQSKFYYMPKMIKETSTGTDDATVFRLDKQMIYLVNDKEKTYSTTTFDQLETSMKGVSSQMDKHMAEIQKKMESLPPEQRKMMEQMMGNKMPGKTSTAKVDVKDTGEKKTIGGYACTKYEISQDGKRLFTIWTTKEMKGFDSMKKDMEEFGQSMAAMMPMNGKAYAEGMKTVEGFPIQTELGTMTMTVTKTEKRLTPSSEFEIPDGYKEVKSKFMHEESKD